MNDVTEELPSSRRRNARSLASAPGKRELPQLKKHAGFGQPKSAARGCLWDAASLPAAPTSPRGENG